MEHGMIVDSALRFVREKLSDTESGHDWRHVYRVWKTAKRLASEEEVDTLVVELGALMHDIADSKFHKNDETIGPRIAREFLEKQGLEPERTDHVIRIIENISFKGEKHVQAFRSRELDVVQDADRLDALGAIGIARAFSYGGYFKRPLYDPDMKPRQGMGKEEYKSNNGTTINHFYEKLLLLKDRMNTESGRRMAQARHMFMQEYLDEFYREWEGQS